METALSTLRLLPFSKQQVEVFADQIKNELESGNVNPLELAIYFKSIEKTVEKVSEKLKELALQEAEKYGKKFEFKGAEISISELGTIYDYSKTGDYEWERWDAAVKQDTDRRKERETMLKGLTGSLTIVNEETGEMETIYPPIKKSTTGISISLK